MNEKLNFTLDIKINKKLTLRKMASHLKTICIHKHWVLYYATMCGIPFRGLVHDLSKFSPSEFIPNARYFTKWRSPIDNQKKDIGFSYAWQHHKGRNPHHYEYWFDDFDDGCWAIRMPYKYTVEMLCDYLAANKAYNGKNASFTSEYKWWISQKDIKAMHPDNKEFLDDIFEILYFMEDYRLNKDKEIYKDLSPVNYETLSNPYFFILNSIFLRNHYNAIVQKNNNPVKMKV